MQEALVGLQKPGSNKSDCIIYEPLWNVICCSVILWTCHHLNEKQEAENKCTAGSADRLTSSVFLLQKVTMAIMGYDSGWIKPHLPHNKSHNFLPAPKLLNWIFIFPTKPLKIIKLVLWGLDWGELKSSIRQK